MKFALYVYVCVYVYVQLVDLDERYLMTGKTGSILIYMCLHTAIYVSYSYCYMCSQVDLDERYLMTGKTGSLRYMAPEVYFHHPRYSE